VTLVTSWERRTLPAAMMNFAGDIEGMTAGALKG
jgi:hypothetical protein